MPAARTRLFSPTQAAAPQCDAGCRLLWFAGMNEGQASQCSDTGGGYAQNYAASLHSAPLDALLPVLMLARYGLENEANLSRLGSWALSKGAHVLQVDALSFQPALARSSLAHTLRARPNKHELLSGYYLRLDVPHFVRDHNLFDLPCACPEYALYTDTDILFWNVSRAAISTALHSLRAMSNAYIMYGRESEMHSAIPQNTGVFFMSVPRLEAELPKLLAFGKHRGFQFDAFDQGWINGYFSGKNQNNRTMLPLKWNWKIYWPTVLETRRRFEGQLHDMAKYTITEFDLSEPIRIIHFHGPKPGGGTYLQCLGSGNADCLNTDLREGTNLPKHQQWSYSALAKRGFKNNASAFADSTLKWYRSLLPHAGAFCRPANGHA